MEPVRFVDCPYGTVVGVQRRIRLADADWGALLGQEYMPMMKAVDAQGEGHPCMGYYFGTGEDGVVDFVMGKPARPGAEATDGLVVRDVPAAHYAVFECGMAEIGSTWGAIYSAWLPASQWREDEAAVCFEAFAPGCMEGAEPVAIHIPVMPRTP